MTRSSGVLDSHTAISHASNLRVDSYVYTREGITEAFKLLKPDGVLSVAFALPNDALGYKLSHILQDMPGAGKPLAVRALYGTNSIPAFIAQKGRTVTIPAGNNSSAFGFKDVSAQFAQSYPEASIPTDDWPFFYMIGRTYPVTYMIALGMVLLLSYFFVRKTIGPSAWSSAAIRRFFLGSGFMLVEHQAPSPNRGCISAAPGFVVAATIVLVLVMAFANLLVQRKAFRRTDSGLSRPTGQPAGRLHLARATTR